jgi:hypothetical protein
VSSELTTILPCSTGRGKKWRVCYLQLDQLANLFNGSKLMIRCLVNMSNMTEMFYF